MLKAMQLAITRTPTRRYGPLVLLSATVIVLGLGLLLSGGAARTWWEVVTLGVVEGVTEFLPISSTAHLLIGARLLHFSQDIGGTFEIFIQLGAILALVVYYARDLLAQARALPTRAPTRRFWLNILLAFLPAAIVGLALRKWIKAVLFAAPALIATSLIVGGLVLIVVELRLRRRVTASKLEDVSSRQALAIGAAQIFALVPGVSRSAASIVGGLLGGLDRSTATMFSFYLAIPTLGAATIVDLLGSIHLVTADDLGRLVVGTLVAFVVAWLSIGWLLRYVASHSFLAFGVYRVIAGVLILGLLGAGLLA